MKPAQCKGFAVTVDSLPGRFTLSLRIDPDTYLGTADPATRSNCSLFSPCPSGPNKKVYCAVSA